MAVRKLSLSPSYLRRKARRVTEFGPELQS
jgi:hypothetical protein